MINSNIPPTVLEALALRRKQVVWTGLAMSALGILALCFPFFTTFTIEILIGWILLFAGLITTHGAFTIQGTGPFFGQILFGLLKVSLGVYLIMHPEVGILALTLLVSALFMVDGAAHFGLAFEIRPHGGWIWILLSGLVSIAAGLLIATGLPEASLFVLGLLVGINFLTTGLSFILLSGLLPSSRF